MTTNGDITIGAALSLATKKIQETGASLTPRLDSEVLLCHLLCCARIDLVLKRDVVLNKNDEKAYFSMIERRTKHEPISYITKTKEFMSLPFFVERGVLIPRPETELLVEYIIDKYESKEKTKILDLCTGSGAIAVSLAHYLKHATVTAVDKFAVCFNAARRNASYHSVTDRVTVLLADILLDFEPNQKFDCIVSNPPYIKNEDLASLLPDVKNYEPKYALDGGRDGLVFYRHIAWFAAEHLLCNGSLVLEIGFDQGESVKSIIEKTNAFHSIDITKDLSGLDRMVTAIKGD